MPGKSNILQLIKSAVLATEPQATVVVYGSYARGDYREDSDIDILVLIDKEVITREDNIRITYPLYDIELDTGIIISPLVYFKKFWENQHKITPFYENVKREGVIL